MRSSFLLLGFSSLALSAACGPIPLPDGSGGSPGTGGSALPETGGGPIGTGGGSGTGGGFIGSGGSGTGGGFIGTGGGLIGTGGGFFGTGGGFFGSGGSGTGGGANTGGGSSTGGSVGTGGDSGTGGTAPELDCNAMMPSSGGQNHNANSQGGSDNLAWQIWSNQTSGTMTTYDVPAFGAQWNNSGDFLARIGYEWGGFNQDPLPHEETGTISAQFAYTRTGNGGGYSYIGIYGWSVDPCVEWYIVDDSYNGMPVNPGNTQPKADLAVDDGNYKVYTRSTSGTGGSRCSSSITQWQQYYSIRTTSRTCGTISISEHFNHWESENMPLGDLLEAKILVEVGGGSGSVSFPVANVMLAPP